MLIQAAAAGSGAVVETYRIGRYTLEERSHTAYSINIHSYTTRGIYIYIYIYICIQYMYAESFLYALSALSIYLPVSLSLVQELFITKEQCALVPYTHFSSFSFFSSVHSFVLVMHTHSLSLSLAFACTFDHLMCTSFSVFSYLLLPFFSHAHTEIAYSSFIRFVSI